MKKLIFSLFFSFFLGLVLSSPPALADPEELPQPGEVFSTYFARITHGGTFPGIRLNAPESFQAAFVKKILKGYWVSGLDKEMKRLQNAGVDIWFDWYKTYSPVSVLEQLSRSSYPNFPALLRTNVLNECGAPSQTDVWAQIPKCARKALTETLLFQWTDLDNKTIISRVAANYGLSADDLKNKTEIFFEDNDGFKKRLHLMGYDRPIYFRGITGLDPQNADRHWVVLNSDLMIKMTPFTHPLLQMLEYAAIVSHELNHVAQDIAGAKLGYDVEVRDAEGAMVIEGMAEFLNEQAWINFSARLPASNPFGLFTREQGVEIVYRDGNEVSGNLFPYTIGVPFMDAFYTLSADKNISMSDTNKELLQVLGGKSNLEDALKVRSFY